MDRLGSVVTLQDRVGHELVNNELENKGGHLTACVPLNDSIFKMQSPYFEGSSLKIALSSNFVKNPVDKVAN